MIDPDKSLDELQKLLDSNDPEINSLIEEMNQMNFEGPEIVRIDPMKQQIKELIKEAEERMKHYDKSI